MADKKKMICNIVFLILVFTGTLYGVFHGEDLGEIVHILKTVNPLWLIPGVICVVVFIWGESIIIFYMMRTLGIKLKNGLAFYSPRSVFSLAVSLRQRQADSRLRYII